RRRGRRGRFRRCGGAHAARCPVAAADGARSASVRALPPRPSCRGGSPRCRVAPRRGRPRRECIGRGGCDLMATLVSFIRHGRTRWNEQERMQGRRDVPLSGQGRAEVTAWRLPAGFDRTAEWISSPLERAMETARLLGGREPRREDALTEMDWGAWEGLTLAQLRGRFGAEFSRMEALGLDFRPPGGESPRDVRRRVQRWLVEVAAHGDAIAAVTHK